MALRERERSGRGCKLDVAMADNLFTFMYWAMGDGLAAQRWPQPGKALVTGGSPRYRIYRTRDDRFIAAAPLEERFWQNFCDAIGLATDARNDGRDPQAAIGAVAARIREKTGEEWQALFAGKDVCCSVVGSIEQALADPHFKAHGVFERKLTADDRSIPALPVPVASGYRGADAAGYPALGEANSLLDQEQKEPLATETHGITRNQENKDHSTAGANIRVAISAMQYGIRCGMNSRRLCCSDLPCASVCFRG